MYQYNIHQWLMFFFIYCFLGWCFESAYVSIKQHSPVNRGFLHGPLLPIYGSGAIAILFAALPFKKWPVAVYFAGMISATVLEYLVGVSMEALFKVRYWDYSNQKFNLQGHICLSSSIAWGFFSDLLIYGIHDPIAHYVLEVPTVWLQHLTFVISLLVTADFIQSLRTALDIRDLIVQAEKLEEEMNRYKRRMEIIDTFAKADFEARRLETRANAEALKESFGHRMESLGERMEGITSRMESLGEHMEGLEEHMEQLESYGIDMRNHLTDSIKDTVDRIENLHAQLVSLQDDKHHSNIEELSAMRMSMELWKERIRKGFSRDKMSMLQRNPSAVSDRMPNLLEDFRKGRKREQE